MRTLLPLFVTALVLAGCSQPGFGPEAADYGAAVRQNIAVQTVNPEPSALPPDGLDGARAALMLGRYRADKVEPPRDISTSNIKTGE